MPWHTALAVFVSFGALYTTAGNQVPLLIAFAFIALASYFVSFRLVDRGAMRLLPHLFLLGLVVVLNQEEPTSSDALIGPPRQRAIFGLLYAGEAVLQFWRQRRDPATTQLYALMAAGMVFLTASNTFEDGFIRWWAPVFALAASVSLLLTRPRKINQTALLLRVGAILMALGLGAASYRGVIVYRGEILDLGNRLIGDRFQFESTGMSQQPQLGPTFNLRGTPVRVLRVRDYGGIPHLRGLSFDYYQGGMWGPTSRERTYQTAQPSDIAPVGSETAPGSVTSTVTRLVNNNALVYTPLNVAAIDLGEAEGPEWSPVAGGPIRARVRAPYEYTFVAPANETYQGLLATPLTPELRTRSLQLPQELDPRIKELARRIAGKAANSPARIEAVAAYLLENHSYSLRFTPKRGFNDPLAAFLLAEPKQGAHCEYFASAAAILLRCVGVPTRYVTGYFAHEGEGSGVTIVRQRDAHAWCEAWVDGIGWVTVEATPADGRPDFEPTPVEPWRRAYEVFQDAMEALAAWMANLSPAQINTAIGTVLAGIVVWGLWARFIRLRRGARFGDTVFSYTAADADIAALSRRFEAAFARAGLPFPAQRPYEEHLTALEATVPEEQKPLVALGRTFAREYNRTRFGGSSPDTRAIDVLRETVETMDELTHDRSRR